MHMREFTQAMPKITILDMSLEIINLWLRTHLPKVNELNVTLHIMHKTLLVSSSQPSLLPQISSSPMSNCTGPDPASPSISSEWTAEKVMDQPLMVRLNTAITSALQLWNPWSTRISHKIPSVMWHSDMVPNNAKPLTHWGRVTHICVGNLTIIGSENGLSPGRRQAIFWTNPGILLIEPLGTDFSAILIEIHTFWLKKMHLKMSSGKWWPFCLGLNVLTGKVMLSH